MLSREELEVEIGKPREAPHTVHRHPTGQCPPPPPSQLLPQARNALTELGTLCTLRCTFMLLYCVLQPGRFSRQPQMW